MHILMVIGAFVVGAIAGFAFMVWLCKDAVQLPW